MVILGLGSFWIQTFLVLGPSLQIPPTSLWLTPAFAMVVNDDPEDDTHILLRNGRFRVNIDYKKSGDTVRSPGHAVSLLNETGFDESAFFWFEDSNDIDVVVRVFDGCSFNENFWVFTGSLTKVDYELRVTDTQTGQSKIYTNPLGVLSPPIQDTQAFATCPQPVGRAKIDFASSLGLHLKEGESLPLIQSRFQVEVDWRIPGEGPGKGTVGVATNTSGSFWFLNRSDPNVYVKIIDGSAINGHFWLAYTSFTGAEYSLRVTDTQTNAVRSYKNLLGESTFGLDTFLTDTADKGLLYPWISNSDQFDSVLVANNTNCLPANITLEANRNQGNPEIVTRTIPPGGFLEEAAADLFPDLGNGSGYSVLLSSSTPGVRGRWVSNNLNTASMASPAQGVAIQLPNQITSPLPLNAQVGHSLLFGYLPLQDNFFSAPVIVNVGDGPTDMSLFFYDKNGNLLLKVDDAITNLLPFRPFAAVAGNLLPGQTENVSMVAHSPDQPLTGVSFVFNTLGEPAIGNATAIDFVPPP